MGRQPRWGICKFSALLLVVIDNFEIRVHHVLIAFGRTASGTAGGPGRLTCLRTRLLSGGLFVELGTDGLEAALQLFVGLFDRVGVGSLQLLANIFDRVFYALLLISRQLVAQFSQLLFTLVCQVVRGVPNLCRFLGFQVFFGVCLGVLAQILDLFLGQSAASGDGNLLFFSTPEIFRGDIQNAVCVNV